MATTQTRHEVPSLDQTFEQVKQLNEQVVKAVREAGTVYLDSYEQLANSYTTAARSLLK